MMPRRGRGAPGAAVAAPAPPPDAATLRRKAITLLALRDHSRAELEQKLLRHGGAAADIASVLDRLQAEKLLSDQRFAEGVVRVRGARYGSAKVAQDLRTRGVGAGIAASLVGKLKASEPERAQSAWQKKFGSAPADARERARQMRFLQARGFASEVIRKVVPRSLAPAPEEED